MRLQQKAEMSTSDKIHELLNRNLQEVFGEGDGRCKQMQTDRQHCGA